MVIQRSTLGRIKLFRLWGRKILHTQLDFGSSYDDTKNVLYSVLVAVIVALGEDAFRAMHFGWMVCNQ